MSNTLKTTALFALLVMILGIFISCTPANQGNGTEGEGTGNVDNSDQGDTGDQVEIPADTDKYIATMTTTFTTDDADMADIIAHMGESVTVVSTDGSAIKIHGESQVGMSSSENEYVYIDGIIYSYTRVNVDGKTASSYEKAAMSAEDSDALIKKAGPGASIGSGDFMTKERSKEGNITTYVCSNMSSASRDSLAGIFAKRFAGYNATVRLVSATYNLELIGDANKSSDLSCDFIVTMNGTDYSFTMNLKCEYEYTSEVSITAPENADKYEETSLEKIIG